MVSLMEHALTLVAEACSKPCISRECKRLSEILGFMGETVDPNVFREGYVQGVVLSLVSSMIKDLAEKAWAQGCRREAALLREAALILSSLT